ncbi:MAG: DUF3500 domain-containing protein [Sneathiellaceae bacterium]
MSIMPRPAGAVPVGRARIEAVTAGGRAFLSQLAGGQAAAALLPFDDDRRGDWHYTPRRRPGLTLQDMPPAARAALWELLAAVLSETGVQRTRDVIRTERALAEITGNLSFRNPENYAILFFGAPQGATPWAWRFEGHHLSLNVTIVPGDPGAIAVTPAFFGANPATVPAGHSHAGLRTLGAEQDIAWQLAGSLDAAQRAAVLLQPRTFGDILTGPGREDSLKAPAGLAFERLAPPQRDLLLALVDSYLAAMQPDIAAAQQADMRQAGLERLHLAWAGAFQPGRPHYFRVHGPTAVIEFDNSQNDANHVHSVWHRPGEGFGADLLSRHYGHGHGAGPAR